MSKFCHLSSAVNVSANSHGKLKTPCKHGLAFPASTLGSAAKDSEL